jgi:hypothetical protein
VVGEQNLIELSGTPGPIRTADLLLRRLPLSLQINNLSSP